MTDALDVRALRRQSLEEFRQAATRYLTKHPEFRSMVLGVSQYFADEAGDAVHEHLFASRGRDPEWPHHCTYGEEDGPAGELICSGCALGELAMPWGTLDSNTDAVFAWSAFCAEYGGGEGDTSLVDPVAIARLGDDGQAELELVHEVVRPWLDDNSVGAQRDAEVSGFDEPERAPAPEPVRAPFTDEERKLFELVLAQPHDDAPRRVLIDHWLKVNDPRGEFGALSFAGQLSAADWRRRDALADEHGRAWVGPLQPFIGVGSATFGRGPFVSRAVVRSAEGANPDQEEWALLESIRFSGEEHVVSAKMRGLREVYGVTATTLAAMNRAGLKAKLHTVGLAELVSPKEWSACAAVADVQHLSFETDDVADVARLVSLSAWSTRATIEVWLQQQDGYEAPRAWVDGRGIQVMRALQPKLGAQTRLAVGYLRGNGARGGVVATCVGPQGELQWESRAFAGPGARADAEAALEGSTQAPAAPAPTPNFMPTQRVGFFQRLFGKR